MNKLLLKKILGILLVLSFSIGVLAADTDDDFLAKLSDLHISQLLVTPGDHTAFIDAISDWSTKSIKLSMYHLSNQDVIDALIAKKKAQPATDIEIILDRGNF